MNPGSSGSLDLADDKFVLLDPAVEILRVEPAGSSLLCHTELEVGMVVPSGAGIMEFIRSLASAPVHVGALREEYDDRSLVDGMLGSLIHYGYAHVTPREAPSRDELERLRAEVDERRGRTLRPSLDVDLDAQGSLEGWPVGDAPPQVLLRASRLSDHTTVLTELARRRHAHMPRAHHVVIRVADARCDDITRDAILRLGAAVEIEGVPWPAPSEPVPGLADLARHRISTHVIMCPDASIFDAGVRERAAAWICREAVSGLCVRLDPVAIWGERSVPDQALIDVLEAVKSIEDRVGDVMVLEMPDDEVLLGNAARALVRPKLSHVANRLRIAYVRWRLPILKSFEGSYVWPQVPEVEAKWVRPTDDLLPNHPELLQLRAGSSILDVCGGLGRVARRLSPAVGDDGVIISVELRRVMTERARRFAGAGGFTNLQFRPGLAQRIPLPDSSVDAAVNEWTGVIWDLGLGPVMVQEMARVVRPGGRVSVTHRLVQLRLEQLDKPWVQYKDIYRLVRDAFEQPTLRIVAERVWGQIVPSIADETPTDWLEIYLPRLVTSDATLGATLGTKAGDEQSTVADVYLTIVAERVAA